MLRLFGRKSSRQIAKDRLKILLISDRMNCSPQMMELIKNDIAHVISKYMKIDASSMDIHIMKTGTSGRTTKTPVLYANIPIVNIKNDMMAEKVKESFVEKFYIEEKGYLRDVISGTAADEQLRCNQIWAVS